MSATEPLEQAIATACGVLANVSKEDLDKQSPCVAWKVRDVVNHLVDGADFFAAGMGEQAAGVGDVTGGDYQAAFDDAAARTLALFTAPGALEKTAQLPFGPMPAGALMGLATTDIFTHAWDLAKATGQSTDLNPELAAQLLPQVQQSIPDMFRGPEGSGMPFGPKQEAPAGACAADQVAAFLGRQV
ncbi:MAG TPA: TIGR03086 family metal-binding protein [Acidimicrobiales bacterium]|nr:TIGR03086 family metal-binding protein [Acidimicrobiales bacterium]